jgi:ATP adenylyltransferase/5',5'''-P-1,P-4-tetraphosphate phosphorylase II
LNNYIVLKNNISNQKPNTVLNKSTSCPFCFNEMEGLTINNKIIDQDKNIVLMENAFPTLDHTYMTVLIEHNACNYDLSNYDKDHLHKLFKFAFDNWLKLTSQKEFKSTIMFKNHGLNSGNSIHHPHMQIVSFKDIDYQLNIKDTDFEGLIINENNKSILNISTHPKVELFEFNIIISDLCHLEEMADKVQIITHYIINYLNTKYQSYNISFYSYKGKYIAKIFSRNFTSIYSIGYNIILTPSNIQEIVNDIQRIYT